MHLESKNVSDAILEGDVTELILPHAYCLCQQGDSLGPLRLVRGIVATASVFHVET